MLCHAGSQGSSGGAELSAPSGLSEVCAPQAPLWRNIWGQIHTLQRLPALLHVGAAAGPAEQVGDEGQREVGEFGGCAWKHRVLGLELGLGLHGLGFRGFGAGGCSATRLPRKTGTAASVRTQPEAQGHLSGPSEHAGRR